MSYWGNRKPDFGLRCGIDWGHPLALSACWCWLLNERGGSIVIDQCSVVPAATFGAPTWAHEGLLLNGSSQYARFITGYDHNRIVTSDGAGTGDFSIVTACISTTLSGTIMTQRRSGGANQVRMGLTTSNNRAFILTYDGSESTLYSQNDASDSNWHQWCGTRSGTTLSIYRDGVPNASNTFTVRDITGATPTAGIGQMFPDNTLWFSGVVAYLLAWNRALSAAEVAWLYAEPYAMIQAPQMPVFYSIPAGGSSIAAISQYYARMRAA